MRLQHAKNVADHLVRVLEPYCERIEIGGSIRRRMMHVSDIELILIPKIGKGETHSLFEEDAPDVNLALQQLNIMVAKGDLQKRARGDGQMCWGPKMQFAKFGEIHVDIFQVLDVQQWGVALALRTGPAELSKAMVTARRFSGLLPDQYYVKDNRVWEYAKPEPLDTRTERDFFRVLGFPSLVDPANRTAKLTPLELEEAAR